MAARSFDDLALDPAPRLDELVLALAAEFGDVAWDRAMDRLGQLGNEVADELGDGPRAPDDEAAACRTVLAERYGMAGNTSDYGDPRNSMLDQVLERRAGLPITLSVVYAEVARRAGIAIAGVGLPGHFVVGHFGADPPLLLDPFGGGVPIPPDPMAEPFVDPWPPHAIALRMLNNLVQSYGVRGDLSRALRAAELRQVLPGHEDLREQQAVEHASLLARLN
jgi:regulator of sirC expression with transglutaminase-like and TPR domain